MNICIIHTYLKKDACSVMVNELTQDRVWSLGRCVVEKLTNSLHISGLQAEVGGNSLIVSWVCSSDGD